MVDLVKLIAPEMVSGDFGEHVYSKTIRSYKFYSIYSIFKKKQQQPVK